VGVVDLLHLSDRHNAESVHRGRLREQPLVLELADNTGLFFVIYAPLALALFWTGVYTKHSAKLSRETDLMLDAIEARIISLKGLK
jgi:hypothetical protein